MIDRILKALELNSEPNSLGGLWDYMNIISTQVPINEESLDNMCMNGLTTGFMGNGIVPYLSNRETLIKLGHALGIYPIKNPEGNLPKADYNYQTNDEIISLIEKKIRFKIRFPDFIGGRTISKSAHGVFSIRHIHYLWVLKRIKELCPNKKTKILEIGPGIGLLAYYLAKNGYNDYTSIDISRTNACQAYFLHKNLPEKELILSKEVEDPFDEKYNSTIRILHETDFANVPDGRFDIMVNMDGLTEYPIEIATHYVNSKCAKKLLSINHEVNTFRVSEICERKRVYRYPFWLRDGYIEELYKHLS